LFSDNTFDLLQSIFVPADHSDVCSSFGRIFSSEFAATQAFWSLPNSMPFGHRVENLHPGLSVSVMFGKKTFFQLLSVLVF